MKITIDTQADSHAEIRKAIKLLYSIIGDSPVYTNEPSAVKNIFDSPSPSLGSSEPEEPAPTNAFANMFGDSDNEDEQTSQVLEKTEESKKDDELVEFY